MAPEWQEGEIEGVVLSPLTPHADPRGWLAELFRADETDAARMPCMGYVSMTHPGVVRGPHEHTEQTDCFAFVGPGDFRVRMWDSRPDSATRGRCRTVIAGQRNPMRVIVPPGVVHAYKNISEDAGLVLNFPNRLYAGPGKRQPVDEIRHEDDAVQRFVME
ncbi:MAG: dTDP-4-dehydrorhamnose 3,5-epimerase family protein [Kiritimatiellae bacterium]|nr:dTDP-4-dehydrorhamnose 3,5-epimerase family protein [Kiritimatiellia bacterium]